MATFNFTTFSNNTVADANAVTTNFQNIKNFVEAQTVQVDGSVKATTASIENNAVTFDKLVNNVPRGVVAKTTRNTNTSSGASVNCFDTALSFTPVVGRLYKVSFSGFAIWNLNDYTTTAEIAFVDSSNNVIQYLVFPPSAAIGSIADSFLIAPTTTAVITINVRINRLTGTDIFYFAGAANKQNYLIVEDLGLA